MKRASITIGLLTCTVALAIGSMVMFGWLVVLVPPLALIVDPPLIACICGGAFIAAARGVPAFLLWLAAIALAWLVCGYALLLLFAQLYAGM